MADAEVALGVGAEAGAVGNVERIEREVAERVGVVALRQQHRGDGRRIIFCIAAQDFEAPGAHRAPRRFGEPGVAGEYVVEAFLVQHVDRYGEALQHLRRRRVGKEADLVHGQHVVPGPERLRQLRRLGCRQRLVADGVERHAGRQHQTFLRAADGDVDAPFVVTVIGRSERGDGVNHQQRRMAGGVDRLADRFNGRKTSGRGLVVQHANRLDLVGLVLAQVLFDRGSVGAGAPIALDELGLEPELFRHDLPKRRELAGLDHQHAVAGRQRIDQSGFPRAGAGRGVDDDRIGGLENRLDAVEAAFRQLGEFRPAVVDDRGVHRAEHAVGQRRRARNLQEMTPGGARNILRHYRHSFGLFMCRGGAVRRRARLVGLNRECDIRVKPNRRQFYAVVNAADLGAEDNLPIRLLPGLERRLKAEEVGEVRFDAFTRGRYSTDASHYQITPLGVVTPRTIEEADRAIAICRADGVPVTARGGGTSQAGQTVNETLVVDCSRHLNRVVDLDVAGRRCVVEPGIVLDELNCKLKPSGLWFPVDISTASRATIGGMVGNNSCGARSLRYGNTRENVLSIDAMLADGTRAHFGRMGDSAVDVPPDLVRDLLAIAAREAGEIERRFPKVQRRVGGYNLDALIPGRNDINLAHLLVGSEGTLAFSTKVELKLSPLLGRRAVGACHFGSFHEAMKAAQHIVALGPIAVELIDRTMLGLARDIAIFQPTVDAFLRGDPEAILFVEFAEEDWDENLHRLKRLVALIGDLGIAWDHG